MHLHLGKKWKYGLPPLIKKSTFWIVDFLISGADSPPLLDFFHFLGHFFFNAPLRTNIFNIYIRSGCKEQIYGDIFFLQISSYLYSLANRQQTRKCNMKYVNIWINIRQNLFWIYLMAEGVHQKFARCPGTIIFNICTQPDWLGVTYSISCIL